MSQLENNTTGLEALLDMVNALPNAGSGGGESELKVATGTFTPIGNIIANNPITVTGIGFKPKIIYAYMASRTNTGIGTNKHHITSIIASDNIFNALYLYINKTSTSSSAATNIKCVTLSAVKVQITDDGFEITSTNTSYYMNSVVWNYIAIG